MFSFSPIYLSVTIHYCIYLTLIIVCNYWLQVSKLQKFSCKFMRIGKEKELIDESYQFRSLNIVKFVCWNWFVSYDILLLRVLVLCEYFSKWMQFFRLLVFFFSSCTFLTLIWQTDTRLHCLMDSDNAIHNLPKKLDLKLKQCYINGIDFCMHAFVTCCVTRRHLLRFTVERHNSFLIIRMILIAFGHHTVSCTQECWMTG